MKGVQTWGCLDKTWKQKGFHPAIYSISSNFAGNKGLASSSSNDHNFLSGVSSFLIT
jgi:hypothetical protein